MHVNGIYIKAAQISSWVLNVRGSKKPFRRAASPPVVKIEGALVWLQLQALREEGGGGRWGTHVIAAQRERVGHAKKKKQPNALWIGGASERNHRNLEDGWIEVRTAAGWGARGAFTFFSPFFFEKAFGFQE